MANLKITIDGQDFTDFIQGTESLSERFFQSDDLKGYLIEVNGDIQCRGEAYDYLRQQFRTNFRTLSQVEIVRISGVNQEKIFDGFIKLSTTEFDLISRVATCELMDNSYMSLIDNNKQIPAVLNAGQTKNGTQMTPANVTTGFDMFNYKTGQYASAYAPDPGWAPPAPFIYGTVEGYYLLDAFNYLVRFMTNGQVDGVISDYLNYNASNPTVAAECALFLGKYLRLREFNEAPEISFYELFRDCHKLFNIWFTIEQQSDGTLKMRIEEYDYFRRRVSNNQIECKTLNDGTFDESLFSSIRVGSAIDDDGYTGRQRFRFQFKEKYGTTGQEGNDTQLDLELEKLITCTNCIKRSMMTTLRGGQETTAYRRALNNGTGSFGVPFLLDSTDSTFADSQTKRGDLVIKDQSVLSAVCGEDGIFLSNPTRQSLDLDIFITDPVPYQMFQADTQFDNDVFLIYCPNKQAEKTQIATLEYAYNDSINSISCVQNHLSGMPSGIAKFLPAGGNNFRAGFDNYTNPELIQWSDPTYFQLTSFNLPLAQYGPSQRNFIVKLQDTSTSPNFDTASNYDPTTGYFTAPADGYYSFFWNVWVSGVGIKAATISRINASNTAVTGASVFNFYSQPTGKLRLAEVVGGFFLTAGESVVAGLVEDAFASFAITNIKSSFSNQGTVVSAKDKVQTYFASLGEDFTGIIGTTDDRNSDLLAINGEGTIASSVWNQIKAQPFNNVQFNYGSNLYLTARPVEIERNILSGDTSYRAIRNFDFGTEPFNENAPQ